MASSKSYTCGVMQEKFTYATLGDLLDKRACQFPDKRAHVLRREVGGSTRDEILTFGELAAKSLQLATALLQRGLRPGDRVAVIGQNCAEWLCLEYALLRTKMLLVRVPSIYIGPDLRETLLVKYGCTALVVHPGQDGDVLKNLERILPDVVSAPNTTIDHLFLMQKSAREEWKGVSTLENIMLAASTDASEIRSIQASISPDDVAIIFPTSGSSGLPKFVTHTHFACINDSLSSVGTFFNLTDPESVYFNDRPFSWMGSHTFVSVVHGITMVNMEFGVSLESIYSAMEEFQGTAVFALPYFLYDAMQLHQSGKSLPNSVKYALTGGEIPPKELIRYGIENISQLTLVYGSTEGIHIAARAYARDDDPEDAWISPLPGVEMKLVRDNQVVPVGEVGEICLRGFKVTKQYLDDPKVTDEVLDKTGWFSTGDVGKMDAKGRVMMLGRTKDVISKGAVKMYPMPIERILANHTGVEKVLVVPVSDPRLHNEICACVVPKQDCSLSVDDLQQYSKEHFDASAAGMIPKYYMILTEFPRGSTGKVDRKIVKKMAEERFGRGEK